MYINTAIITAAIQSKTVLFVCSSVNAREIRPSVIRPGPGIRRTSEKQKLDNFTYLYILYNQDIIIALEYVDILNYPNRSIVGKLFLFGELNGLF